MTGKFRTIEETPVHQHHVNDTVRDGNIARCREVTAALQAVAPRGALRRVDWQYDDGLDPLCRTPVLNCELIDPKGGPDLLVNQYQFTQQGIEAAMVWLRCGYRLWHNLHADA